MDLLFWLFIIINQLDIINGCFSTTSSGTTTSVGETTTSTTTTMKSYYYNPSEF